MFLVSDILGISWEVLGNWNEICNMVKKVHFSFGM